MIKDLSTSEGASIVNKTVGDAISAQIGAPSYGIYQLYCFGINYTVFGINS
jgi:hypothetical protein